MEVGEQQADISPKCDIDVSVSVRCDDDTSPRYGDAKTPTMDDQVLLLSPPGLKTIPEQPDRDDSKLSNEQKDLFNHLDVDKKGKITLDDITNGLNGAIEEQIPIEDVTRKFKEIDVEGKGSIDLD